MAAILNGGELTLSGDVGDVWYGDGFTYADVVVALAQVDTAAELTVRLNSGGGLASEGAAIHALLTARAGTTNVTIEGIAASAGSLIAMAGDTVTMAAGAIMMIHDPANMSFGNSDDHAKNIEYLEALATSYARVYATKSGKTVDECRTIMKAETWLTADEAIEGGFADAPGDTKAKAVAAFDYRAYAHAPKRLTALASKKNWSQPEASKAALAAPNRPNQEVSMPDNNAAATSAAELDRAKAEASAGATKTTGELAASIVEACASAGVPAMAAALIREGVTLDEAKARASNVKEIRSAVALANSMHPALNANPETYIAAGMSQEAVSADLFQKIAAAQSPELLNAHQPGGTQGGAPKVDLVANMKQRVGAK